MLSHGASSGGINSSPTPLDPPGDVDVDGTAQCERVRRSDVTRQVLPWNQRHNPPDERGEQ
jgi:hypothetical protein